MRVLYEEHQAIRLQHALDFAHSVLQIRVPRNVAEHERNPYDIDGPVSQRYTAIHDRMILDALVPRRDVQQLLNDVDTDRAPADQLRESRGESSGPAAEIEHEMLGALQVALQDRK